MGSEGLEVHDSTEVRMFQDWVSFAEPQHGAQDDRAVALTRSWPLLQPSPVLASRH